MTTTATAPDVPAAITLPRGIARAVQLHMVTLVRTLSWPWAILGISFAINLALGALGAFDKGEGDFTGGLASLYIVVMVAYLQAMTQLFPFALGIGVSRRSFFLGTVTFAAAQAVLYGGLVLLLSLVEDASDGWGVHMRFFGVPWLTAGANPLELLVTYVVPVFVMATIAMFVGSLHTRWGGNGLLTASAIGAIVLGGTGVLITWQDGWNAVGRWFAHSGALALTAGWPWVLAVLCLAGAWLVLRRTTP